LFLGDSISYSGQYIAYVEAYLVTRHAGNPDVEFMNLGLPSETVSGLSEPGHADGQFPRPDLHERLGRVLEQTKPDLVFACYGMNDGIYLPLEAGRFQKFKDGIDRLHKEVTAAGAKIVHLTPPPFDGTKGGNAEYGAVLERYSEWLLGRRADGWDVIDLNGPMTRYTAERRKKEPDFALAGDGVHPGELGHWLMAKQILLHLGATDVTDAGDAKEMASSHPRGEKMLELISQRQELMRDAWLTATGHKRPGIGPGLPLNDARTKAEDLDKEIEAWSLQRP
jgi:lysophospholipase L1-like esterase